MARRSRTWVWLLAAAWAAAGLLVALVLLGPRLDDGGDAPAGWRRAAALFGHDAVVRRTCLASAAGLLATGWVFFRPPSHTPAPGPDRPRRPRSSGVAGA
jgi:hypothetical protein